ncbi:MAG: hydrolase [Verrucomicrobiales bacterium]|nr:hydrolase [Verrucomicrobiales bacterium]
MELPYKVATLLYCFDEADNVLLLERYQEPNLGLWSPCGGKLNTSTGESPYQCAIREASEEISLSLRPQDLHLAGIVSEAGYEGNSHWLMFLFEVLPKLKALPAPHREGRFAFFNRTELDGLSIPVTDRETIWPLFWKNRGGFFSAHCRCTSASTSWAVEEQRPLTEQA